MNKYSVEAAHVVNMYLWQKLQAELPLRWQPVAGLETAIIPAQEQPELTESGKNYITYIYSDQPSKDLYALQSQDLSWILFSPSAGTISSTIALCRDLFGRWDDSAKELNNWMRTAAFPTDYAQWYKRYYFKTMQVTGTTSSQPSTDEGGTKDGLVTVTYSFVEFDS